MVAAAGAIAWAYFTGRLDGVIAQAISRAEGIHAATVGSAGGSGTGAGAGAGQGAGGGGGGSW